MESSNSPGTKQQDVPANQNETTDELPPLLRLPRELRDQIYDYIFSLPETRDSSALRIERRHIRHFRPTPATILLLLHHSSLLLNQQIATEALETLLKRHTVYLSCGPFVLKTFLSRIETDCVHGKQRLRLLSRISLDWTTFPNLRNYPPNRENAKDEWWWEDDGMDVDLDYVVGGLDPGHDDEYDYEGDGYDDNMYLPDDPALYPTFPTLESRAFAAADPASDPFGFGSHYPFAHPSATDTGTSDSSDEYVTLESTADDATLKLGMLVDMEVKPLFTYLSSPSRFPNLTSIELPLYFISKHTLQARSHSINPDAKLPLFLRYWIAVVAEALYLLLSSPSLSRTSTAKPLKEVRVCYRPVNIWASLDPPEDLPRIVEKGVWLNSFVDEWDEETMEVQPGQVWIAVWGALRQMGVKGAMREILECRRRLVKWDCDLDKRVGDEVEVVFRRMGEGGVD
ncbi:hypothetical protein M011DRAFT_183172 [Sporormia fimetaria CBS 119925]|uniref:F-box domain-containing protein n=1 Tax=Sporormia fimetaria CBS 119925 TaxID=1340428 RepID=A0A6A6VLV3_9PLEO|nr:hypothetical protein M011DRAFT_183172 [Sporormia fimetaria CBS 119925]